MITIVVFLWNDGFRHYLPEHVNILAHACRYFYPEPHRFVCITDETEGFSDAVELFPMPTAAAEMGKLGAPQGKDYPSSYRRLWLFSEDAKALGERILLLDIDCMIVGDLRPLLAAQGDFVGWTPQCSWGRENRIGGGTWLLRTGSKTELWEAFYKNPVKTIEETKQMGWHGSDQAVMSRYLVGTDRWPRYCGIYSSQDGVMAWSIPPKDACIVHFNGRSKGWDQKALWMDAYHAHFLNPPAFTVEDFTAHPA